MPSLSLPYFVGPPAIHVPNVIIDHPMIVETMDTVCVMQEFIV